MQQLSVGVAPTTLANSKFHSEYSKAEAPTRQHVMFAALLDLLLAYCKCAPDRIACCIHARITC